MSNEQKMAIFSLLYDEQMCNWLRVVHLARYIFCLCDQTWLVKNTLAEVLAHLHM